MASYHDLLDAIARVRAATGDPEAWTQGLTGADIAVACAPTSPPGAVSAVLAKVAAAHPGVFTAATPAADPSDTPPSPRTSEGASADAIRDAEAALARQRSAAAHVDLQVLTAVRSAHATARDGLRQLNDLQREIEAAVATRTDLATPAGAREFQGYLIGKTRDIRDVVENAGLDAASKASLAEALAALYASSTPDVSDQPAVGDRHGTGEASDPGDHTDAETSRGATPSALGAVSDPLDSELLDGGDSPLTQPWSEPAALDPAAGPAAAAPAAAPAFPASPAMPSPWPGALPSGAPSGGMPGLGGTPWTGSGPGGTMPFDALDGRDPLNDGPLRFGALEQSADEGGSTAGEDAMDTEDPGVPAQEDSEPPPDETAPDETSPDETTVLLPDGDSVTAPSPELAAVITAAVAGAPIAEAFAGQGITIPAPGSAVPSPIDPARLVPGDIGVFADRHALALGNGKALLDSHIQPISSMTRSGFIGWQHPPEREPMNAMPPTPAPDRSAATVPS